MVTGIEALVSENTRNELGWGWGRHNQELIPNTREISALKLVKKAKILKHELFSVSSMLTYCS